MAKFNYMVGSGNAYLNALERAGISLSETLPEDVRLKYSASANNTGIAYSALLLIGTNIPLFIFISLIIAYSFGLTEKLSKGAIWSSIAAAIFLGISGVTLAQIQMGKIFSVAFSGAIGLLVLACLCFCTLFLIVWGAKTLLARISNHDRT